MECYVAQQKRIFSYLMRHQEKQNIECRTNRNTLLVLSMVQQTWGAVQEPEPVGRNRGLLRRFLIVVHLIVLGYVNSEVLLDLLRLKRGHTEVKRSPRVTWDPIMQ